MSKKEFSNWTIWLEWFVALFVLGSVYGHKLQDLPFDWDESQWIATSCYLEALVQPNFGISENLLPTKINRGLPKPYMDNMPEWVRSALVRSNPTHGIWEACNWTLTQPPVARYFIGLGRLLAGYQITDLNGPYIFYRSTAENETLGNIPSVGLLTSARQMMAILAVLSGIILFRFLRSTIGAMAAYQFLLMYVCSSFLLLHLRRAMAESTLLVFTSLCLVLGLSALVAWQKLRNLEQFSASNWLPILLRLTLLGIAAGLAGASKLNGLLLTGMGPALGVVIGFGTRRFNLLWQRCTVALGVGTLVSLIACSAFIAVNPFLYHQPFERTVAMIYFRAYLLSESMIKFEWDIPNLTTRLSTASTHIFQNYWAAPYFYFNLALLAIGVFRLCRMAWLWLRGIGGTPSSVVILIGAALTALPALSSPLNWARYYLYPVIFTIMFVAIGIDTVFNAALAWRAHKLREGEGRGG